MSEPVKRSRYPPSDDSEESSESDSEESSLEVPTVKYSSSASGIRGPRGDRGVRGPLGDRLASRASNGLGLRRLAREPRLVSLYAMGLRSPMQYIVLYWISHGIVLAAWYSLSLCSMQYIVLYRISHVLGAA